MSQFFLTSKQLSLHMKIINMEMACKVLALQVCGLDPRCLGRSLGVNTAGMGTYRTGCLGREWSRC